jgi:hypothetical protein
MLSTKLGPLQQTAPAPGSYSGKGSISGKDQPGSIDNNSSDFSLPERKKWRGSVGGSFRTLGADFKNEGSPARSYTGTSSSVADGSVSTQVNPDGTATFTGGVQTATGRQQIFTNRAAQTSLLSTPIESKVSVEDDISLYSLDLHRTVAEFNGGGIEVGLSYSYANSELDSGVGAIRLDQEFRTTTNTLSIFDVVRGTNGTQVIANGDLFRTAYLIPRDGTPPPSPVAAPDPQVRTEVIRDEVGRAVVYAGSKLEVNMHEMQLPISIFFNRGRFQAGLSFGPTLTVLDAELETSAYLQDVSNVERAAGVYLNPDNVNRQIDAPNLTFLDRTYSDTGGDPVRGGQSVSVGVSQASSQGPSQGVGQGIVVNPPSPPQGGRGGERGLPGTAVPSGSDRSRAQDTAFQFGLMAQAFIRVDLDAKRLYYMEAFGRYNWVQSHRIGNDFDSANIDATAWSAGLVVGRRF